MNDVRIGTRRTKKKSMLRVDTSDASGGRDSSALTRTHKLYFCLVPLSLFFEIFPLFPIMMDSLDNITPIITTTTTSSSRSIANTTFLHFNDVYNIEKAPCFIASLTNARNAKVRSKLLPGKTDGEENSSSICRVRRHSKVITLFSGDAFSPSMMSTVLKGKQMIPVLNACNIDAACLGESL